MKKKNRAAKIKKLKLKKIKIKKNKKPALKLRKVFSVKKNPIKKINKKNKKQNKIKKRTKKVVRKKLFKKRPRKKNTTIIKNNSSEVFSAKSFFKAKIKVIGIGGGGSSIVSEIGRSLNKASFVVADTDVRAFKNRRGIKQFLFGQELTHGLGTGLNVDLARRAAEQEKEKIAKLFSGQDIVILIACLGGGLGSGAAKVFTEAAENFNGIVFGIFTLPFKFEGKNKHKIASKALSQLRNSLDVSLTIPNERIFKIINPDTAITDAFSMVNRSLVESLESLIDLIYNPGVINIDFADLRAILKGKGNLAFLNTVEASGKDRIEEINQKILHNPLYQNLPGIDRGTGFTADKILFNISGGSTLSMLEVDKISRTISAANPRAKIIFGISKDSKYKNKIKTTLLMTGGAVVKPAVIVKIPLVKKVVTSIQRIKKSKDLNVNKKVVKKIKTKKKKTIIKDKIKKAPGVTENDNTFLGQTDEKRIPFGDKLPQVFGGVPMDILGARKLSIVESSQPFNANQDRDEKRAIRRTALDIKKAEEIEENRKSEQEKEWEIPAFLRKIKSKS
ncbi:MAG: hypothetical protein UR46_C0006G0011 [Parcubacteria group bacterium GW2011_GWA1_33_6]|uniref:Cell division protein FtsZ n=1 Tax=Candidatus Staskawiczbacteria bacterium RIFCSPHIGHO2_02_FULL_33_16 TaxID=1802204 RepID=A0A1G2HRZ5_9BACT|nr:MAG: hypothetical protein UR31_C0020G0012 [Parcubacteria group bacterium GW2011_GWA2_33_14]KKP55280.1 MAG: hypothetical protein UR46_C0006G0011 [Parcubacteria group bacterium GW2011_GWA1_33_6]OGZ65316.1 MAG: hypothetical protein A3D34_01840 [Candidatus Staskawiczbacteria bacterium RIFCSPHIGHO2_02_FULL_33_16]OGZ69939.1 MAG: hypothetical protein A2980_00420 [Candidatus Staskawiczbacteria bacterium RIFCSPLOWO2_01_FULL_33_13]